MIPKIIHYCWFGKNEMPENVKKCIDSWRRLCPSYEIIKWDESNYDFHKNQYISEAYKKGKFAFVSDFARLDIIYNNGGIYLDTDVELIKPFDDLLDNHCYFGCEFPGVIATGLGFGAEKKHDFLKDNMAEYSSEHFVVNGKTNTTTCVEYTMRALSGKGIKKVDYIQKFDDVVVFPPEYFCPLSLYTNKLKISEKTYSIHHYDATWYGNNNTKKIIKKKIIPIKIFAKTTINNIFGEGTYEKIKNRIS